MTDAAEEIVDEVREAIGRLFQKGTPVTVQRLGASWSSPEEVDFEWTGGQVEVHVPEVKAGTLAAMPEEIPWAAGGFKGTALLARIACGPRDMVLEFDILDLEFSRAT